MMYSRGSTMRTVTDQEAEKEPAMDYDDQGSTDKVKQMAKAAMNRRK